MTEEQDPGKHYRYTYKGIKLDPFRICQIYEVYDFALQTIIKKALKAGGRGHKDMRQDLLDIINSAQRKLEMMDEDEKKIELTPSLAKMGESILKMKEGSLVYGEKCTYPNCNCQIEKPFDHSPCLKGL